MHADTAIINVTLAKRGNIDAQLDAANKEAKRAANARSIQRNRAGVLHLFKGKFPQVFANRTQAENAAAKFGGIAYQSRLSACFLVRFEG